MIKRILLALVFIGPGYISVAQTEVSLTVSLHSKRFAFPGVRVSIFREDSMIRKGITNGQGKFKTSLPPGNYMLMAYRPRFGELTDSITIGTIADTSIYMIYTLTNPCFKADVVCPVCSGNEVLPLDHSGEPIKGNYTDPENGEVPVVCGYVAYRQPPPYNWYCEKDSVKFRIDW